MCWFVCWRPLILTWFWNCEQNEFSVIHFCLCCEHFVYRSMRSMSALTIGSINSKGIFSNENYPLSLCSMWVLFNTEQSYQTFFGHPGQNSNWITNSAGIFELIWTIWGHFNLILEWHLVFHTITDLHPGIVSELQGPYHQWWVTLTSFLHKVFFSWYALLWMMLCDTQHMDLFLICQGSF